MSPDKSVTYLPDCSRSSGNLLLLDCGPQRLYLGDEFIETTVCAIYEEWQGDPKQRDDHSDERKKHCKGRHSLPL